MFGFGLADVPRLLQLIVRGVASGLLIDPDMVIVLNEHLKFFEYSLISDFVNEWQV